MPGHFAHRQTHLRGTWKWVVSGSRAGLPWGGAWPRMRVTARERFPGLSQNPCFRRLLSASWPPEPAWRCESHLESQDSTSPEAWASRLRVLQCRPDSTTLGASWPQIVQSVWAAGPLRAPLAPPTPCVTSTAPCPLALLPLSCALLGGAALREPAGTCWVCHRQEPHLAQPPSRGWLWPLGLPSHHAEAAGVSRGAML